MVTQEKGRPSLVPCRLSISGPAGVGIDIVFRYIVRAGVRVETRNQLFAMIVDRIQGGSKDDKTPAQTPLQTALKG